MENKELTFTVDPSDFDGMLEVMDKYGDSETMYFGKNEDEENVTISVFHDMIVVETYQTNGWVRKDIHHRDGSREEMYNGRWKR